MSSSGLASVFRTASAAAVGSYRGLSVWSSGTTSSSSYSKPPSDTSSSKTAHISLLESLLVRDSTGRVMPDVMVGAGQVQSEPKSIVVKNGWDLISVAVGRDVGSGLRTSSISDFASSSKPAGYSKCRFRIFWNVR